AHCLAHASSRDVVFLIEGQLALPAPLGLVDGTSHGIRDAICVKNRPAIQIARSPTYSLNETAFGTEEAFLVCIQNGHKRDLRYVQPFTQQVDANQHVEHAKPKVADDFHSLDSIDIRMQVAHLEAVFDQIICEVFRHALGQGRHKNP